MHRLPCWTCVYAGLLQHMSPDHARPGQAQHSHSRSHASDMNGRLWGRPASRPCSSGWGMAASLRSCKASFVRHKSHDRQALQITVHPQQASCPAR